MRGNWWGIPDAVAIADQIYDGNDNPADSPMVDYQPVQPALLTADSPLSPDLDTAVGFTNDPAYTLSGTAEPNREIRVYRNDELQGSVTSAANGAFALGLTLTTGDNLLYANAVNSAEEESLPYKTHTVVLDQTPPVITLTSPANNATVNYATFVGQFDEPATVTVNGEPATVNADNSFSHVLGGLPQGSNSATIIATDRAGNSSTLDVSFTLDSTPPATPDTGQITVGAVSGGQVTVSGPAGGATEGDTVTLTNSRTGQSVQTTVAADGSYSAQIGAQAGDEIALTISDDAGNATPSRILQVAGTAPAVGLAVGSPSDGGTIGDDRAGVSGSYQGPANVGIQVNGITAQLIGSTFCAADVPLQAGSNTLEAVITAPDGSTTSQLISVTSAGSSPLRLNADRASGFAPLTVTFSLADTTGWTFTAINFDLDGNGSIDYTTTDPAETVTHTYNTPGCYTATVTGQDVVTGNTVTSQQVIAVIDDQDLEGRLLGLWRGMLHKLRNGDSSGALSVISPPARDRYQSIFTDLQAELPTVVDAIGDISRSALGEDLAEFQVTRNRDGIPQAYLIYMMRNGNGVWQIEGM